jgi:hypothetical protein
VPLFVLNAADAVATRKGNAHADWGHRHADNRVEPIARPAFDVPFSLPLGASIFTVGSCFARNVEQELARRGFRVPVLDLFKQPEFAGMNAGVISNFGTPSIYNEFAWAFGAKTFNSADHILEVMPGKFTDLHVHSDVRPDAYEMVLRRRAAITAAYRTAADCQLMIITLGLVESWFDQQTGCYLNTPPRPGLIKQHPLRFQLHVLSYEETLDYLNRTLQLLRSHMPASARIMLTVSPVPLSATHRPMDVMVANCYSKSVQRAAVEAAIATHPAAFYFPSYESVTLSERQVAWNDDLIHPTNEIIAENVGRMVQAFSANAADPVTASADFDAPVNAKALTEAARAARKDTVPNATSFFTRHAAVSRNDIGFAVQHAWFLQSRREHAQAVAVMEQAPEWSQSIPAEVVYCTALVDVGRNTEAASRLEARLVGNNPKWSGVWRTLLHATLAGNVEADILSVATRWRQARPNEAWHPNFLVGKWYFARGQAAAAVEFLDMALKFEPENGNIRIVLADALLSLGRRAEAAAVLQELGDTKAWINVRAAGLRKLLPIAAHPAGVPTSASRLARWFGR